MLLSALLFLPCLAQVTEYTARPSWEGAVGTVNTANFTAYANGTTITSQYAALGMTFTQGNDTVLVSGAFVVDGVGLNCNGDCEITFSSPQNAIGVDFPGAIKLDIYSGASLIHSSSNFAGSGSGFFAGLTSVASFNRVVISDWFDGLAYFDNVSIAGGGFTLAKSGTCPGAVSLTTTGGSANGAVAIVYGAPGSFTKPSGTCAGLTLSIGNPALGAILSANGSGTAAVAFNALAAWCGKTVQAVNINTCSASNTIAL